MNFIKWFVEALAWLQIAVTPLLIGAIVGLGIYLAHPTRTRLLIAIGIAFSGLVFGIIWATRVWKKQGTTNFISKAYSSGRRKQASDNQN